MSKKKSKTKDYDQKAAYEDDGTGRRLYLTIVKGEGLAKRDSGKDRTSDPFVVMKYGKLEQKTTAKYNTLNPHWDESFEFMYNPNVDELMLFLWDKDPTLNDTMGQVIIPKSHFGDEADPVWYKVYDAKGKQTEKAKGRLQVVCYVAENRRSSRRASKDRSGSNSGSEPYPAFAARDARDDDRGDRASRRERDDRRGDRGDRRGDRDDRRGDRDDRRGDRDDRRGDRDRRDDRRSPRHHDDYRYYDDRRSRRDEYDFDAYAQRAEREAFAAEYERMTERILRHAARAREDAAEAPYMAALRGTGPYEGGYGGYGAVDAPYVPAVARASAPAERARYA